MKSNYYTKQDVIYNKVHLQDCLDYHVQSMDIHNGIHIMNMIDVISNKHFDYPIKGCSTFVALLFLV